MFVQEIVFMLVGVLLGYCASLLVDRNARELQSRYDYLMHMYEIHEKRFREALPDWDFEYHVSKFRAKGGKSKLQIRCSIMNWSDQRVESFKVEPHSYSGEQWFDFREVESDSWEDCVYIFDRRPDGEHFLVESDDRGEFYLPSCSVAELILDDVVDGVECILISFKDTGISPPVPGISAVKLPVPPYISMQKYRHF